MSKARDRAYELIRLKRPQPHPEDSESSWLVSYADMMTLLVGFFVMIASFSSIDPSAFENVKKETTKVFGGEYQVPFEDLSKKLQTEVDAQNAGSQVIFQQTDAGVEISFRGALFFDLGASDLKQGAIELLDKIIPIIAENSKELGILIEGHTDDNPVSGPQYKSNWELSSVRACSVLRLFEEKGFPRARLKAVGYADTKPTFPNSDEKGNKLPENQAQNRRVVIKVLKDFKD